MLLKWRRWYKIVNLSYYLIVCVFFRHFGVYLRALVNGKKKCSKIKEFQVRIFVMGKILNISSGTETNSPTSLIQVPFNVGKYLGKFAVNGSFYRSLVYFAYLNLPLYSFRQNYREIKDSKVFLFCFKFCTKNYVKERLINCLQGYHFGDFVHHTFFAF